MDRKLIEQFDKARANADPNEPRAIEAYYAAAERYLWVKLSTGELMGFPIDRLQGLSDGSDEQIAQIEIYPGGHGLHWEQLDADLSVPGLVAGLFGSKTWMSALGKAGGSKLSIAKVSAARINGKLGGRPKKHESQ